jgi:hypothetical protein
MANDNDKNNFSSIISFASPIYASHGYVDIENTYPTRAILPGVAGPVGVRPEVRTVAKINQALKSFPVSLGHSPGDAVTCINTTGAIEACLYNQTDKCTVAAGQSGIHHIWVVFSPATHPLSENPSFSFVLLSQSASFSRDSLPGGHIGCKPQGGLAVHLVHSCSFPEGIKHYLRLVMPKCLIKNNLSCKLDGKMTTRERRFEVRKNDMDNLHVTPLCGRFEAASKSESASEYLRVFSE